MMTASQMEDPKAPIGAFQLPCGYIDPATNEVFTDVEVRELTGVEEDIMASRQVPSDRKLSMLLAGCTQRIGTITDRAKINRIIDDLMIGDRVFLLFAIRRVTLGDEMPLRQTCPACRVSSLYVIDLSTLTIKQMPDSRKRVHDVTLPSGQTARFRVSVGHDEQTSAKLARQKDTDGNSRAIMMRLELLGDEPPTLDAVKHMSFRDRAYLREQFDAVEGGVDTGLDFECPACKHEWKEELSLGASSFFSLSEAQKH